MKKSIKDKDFSDITKASYRLLFSELGYTARISDIWKMLCITYGKKEFDILDLNRRAVLEFESYLMDLYIKWNQGETIDFENLEKSILEFGDFTSVEKLLILSGDFQERLWAIFLCLSNPDMNL